MGGKGSGRKDTGVARLMHTRIKKEYYLRHPKLTEEEVNEIRRLRADGLTQREIANKVGVSQASVCVYLMSEDDRKEYMENRKAAHRLWIKEHKKQYHKIIARKRHLNEIGGLVEEDWRGGVKIYDK